MPRISLSFVCRALCVVCAAVVMSSWIPAFAADHDSTETQYQGLEAGTAADRLPFGYSFPDTVFSPEVPPGFSPEIPNIVSSMIPPVAQSALTDHILPDGLLYRSYIAGPNEPRFASILIYDTSAQHWRCDATLGGRVGLFRRDQPEFAGLDAWQVDLEGATMTRLNPEQFMDVESTDYRFGLLSTGQRDNLAVKFGYFHISSHVGDEYLLTNPTFKRVNFVRESLILGISQQATPQVRTYGEVAWACAVRGGAKPWQFQLGTEYSAKAPHPKRGAPFSAVNASLREEVKYAPGMTGMTGWQWKGTESGRSMRIGLQCYNGPSNQYEFFRRYDNQLGMGVWFDY